MKTSIGLNFDAVSCEMIFGKLLEIPTGARGNINDADIFRHGSKNDLGILLEETVLTLENRISRISFSSEEESRNKEIIDINIKGLTKIAEGMKDSQEDEPSDYHWLIIAKLLRLIDCMMEKLEA